MDNFDLAKQLKAADFPYGRQITEAIYYVRANGDVGCINKFFKSGYENSIPEDAERLLIPTLERLIEVCDKSYTENGTLYEFMLMYAKGTWCAGYSDPDFKSPNKPLDRIGKSPEEAVARLWLALNNK